MMTLHTIMATVFSHPLQMLCIGMLVVRGLHAIVSGAQEKWRLRRPDAGLRPVHALTLRDGRHRATREQRGRFTDFRRQTAAGPTAA